MLTDTNIAIYTKIIIVTQSVPGNDEPETSLNRGRTKLTCLIKKKYLLKPPVFWTCISLFGEEKSYLLLLCSKDIIDEYLKVPAYPEFKLTDTEIGYLLTVEILPWFKPVTVRKGKPSINNDPQDDMFIWCAVEGKADAVISGDSHLLNIKNPQVPVFTVINFLKQLMG